MRGAWEEAGCAVIKKREKEMADELSEKLLRYAPQTLAGIKTGSIFHIHDIAVGMLELEIAVLNSKLNPMDIYIERVQSKKGNSLIYVYRKQQLIRDLEDPTARKLLWYKGYPFVGADADTILYGRIEHLKERLTDYDCFPHEIGLFLGFPVEDVKAFIEKDGHDCLTCGFWKVYCNKSQALETFRQYKICARIYNEAADLKIPVTRMTVNLRNVDISRGYRKAS